VPIPRPPRPLPGPFPHLTRSPSPSTQVAAVEKARADNARRSGTSFYQRCLGVVEGSIALATKFEAAVVREDSERGDRAMHLQSYPKGFRGDMHAYQWQGFKWLARHSFCNESAVLGDEMGLGKTIQVLALLSWERQALGGVNTLIIVPKTTLGNWMAEIDKFAPALGRYAATSGEPGGAPTPECKPALLYYDEAGGEAGRELLRKRWLTDEAYRSFTANLPVFVTTYEVAVRDADFLSRVRWRTLVLDEGHRLKNTEGKTRDLLSRYNSGSVGMRAGDMTAQVRIVLTGTPVQNDFGELFSLLNFVMPKIFNDQVAFTEVYRACGKHTAAEGEYLRIGEDRDRIISKLHQLLNRFMLRRTKREVRLNLPPKVECVVFAALSPVQQRLRKALLNINGREISSELRAMRWVDRNSGREDTLKVSTNNAEMNERKLCCHPYLFAEPGDVFNSGEDSDEIISSSGKMVVLDKMLRRLRREGHKVIIFSQFKQMIDILGDYFRYVGEDVLGQYRAIDGQSKSEDRTSAIAEFQSDPNNKIFAFLLSSKAGGVGINLCAADTVIFYDNDWNPKADEQAQDRAHRIGQVRPVVVYRLVTEGQSVERHMMNVASSKVAFGRVVLKEGAFLAAEAGKGRAKDEDDEDEGAPPSSSPVAAAAPSLSAP
jgi:SNF2 family DNA or RNA helicase